MEQEHLQLAAAVRGTTSAAATQPATRAQSRASTASVNSAMDHSGFSDGSAMYGGQWVPKDMASASQMDDMLLAAASQMHSSHEFGMESSGNNNSNPSMSAPMPHTTAHGPLSYNQPSQHSHIQHHHHQQQQQQRQQQQQQQQQQHRQKQVAGTRHPLPNEQHFTAANASFTDGDIHMMDRDEEGDAESVMGALNASRPTTSRSSANNELEMKQLFRANEHRDLQDVAQELHGNERGPNSERTRQVFAMLWINSVCARGRGSVPRGRVYANYASRCATERITVLNPASFGKLVRVLFPGLKTRRLGVRGESKYHYVNFSLAEDQPDPKDVQPVASQPQPEAKSASRGPSQTNGTARHVPLPPIQVVNKSDGSSEPPSLGSQLHSFYNLPELTNIENIRSTSAKTIRELAIPCDEDSEINKSDVLMLPPIEDYLPSGTDPDAAKSLSALYRSHCTSLLECIRYCRQKTFFHLYTSFQGTLTMPVQKLLAHEALAPWIEGCDYVLYQRMMLILSALTLQVLPKPVLDTMRNVSERLVPHIRESFQGQPQHVIAAKEAPAAVFAGLLDRAMRVNLTAHAAANMLSNPANRDVMYYDWISLIRTRKIAETVPTRAMDDLVDLLLSEVRDLIDPQSVPWEIECLSIYGDIASRSKPIGAGPERENPEANVLEKWVKFIRSLPQRFPYASPSDLVWGIERVGTAVMRELTLNHGKSFGSWWVTKTWLDEMSWFIFEQGGFMKPKVTRRVAVNTGADTAKEASSHNTGCDTSRSSASSAPEIKEASNSQSQPERAPFPPPPGNSQLQKGMAATSATPMTSTADPHDDSGIGMRTPDEEYTMHKFSFAGPDTMRMMNVAELGVAAGGL
ncbi:hypothetical protein CDD81_3777 [Ophiocordyceps australis]|uniref:RFX-type winged-helix domain-containing protein n=1 Tax=Ophiocordyceps australis TaxID=1399860 RepID=A0A2C5YBT0_9HYPO|nr:hypothetical protein CDD81_3777 [Ophiocordyceps australis]